MVTNPVLPSSIGTVRAWMRLNVPIVTLTGSRQYFEMPRKDTPILPFIVLYRAGGAPDEFGQDYPDILFECWGENRTVAEDLGLVLAREIIGIKPVLASSAWMLAGKVNTGPIEMSSTPNAKRSRVDATFHIRSAM